MVLHASSGLISIVVVVVSIVAVVAAFAAECASPGGFRKAAVGVDVVDQKTRGHGKKTQLLFHHDHDVVLVVALLGAYPHQILMEAGGQPAERFHDYP